MIIGTSELLTKGVRKTKVKKGSKEEKLHILKEEVKSSIQKLKGLRHYYESVTDKELIDYAIYSVKAEEERISYLIRKIKEIDKGI